MEQLYCQTNIIIDSFSEISLVISRRNVAIVRMSWCLCVCVRALGIAFPNISNYCYLLHCEWHAIATVSKL